MSWLDDQLTARNIGTTEVARACGVHRTAVWAWREGGAVPQTGRLQRLADLLSISLEELVEGLTGGADADG